MQATPHELQAETLTLCKLQQGVRGCHYRSQHSLPQCGKRLVPARQRRRCQRALQRVQAPTRHEETRYWAALQTQLQWPQKLMLPWQPQRRARLCRQA